MACSSCVPVTAMLRALRSSTASASLPVGPSKVTTLASFSVTQAMPVLGSAFRRKPAAGRPSTIPKLHPEHAWVGSELCTPPAEVFMEWRMKPLASL